VYQIENSQLRIKNTHLIWHANQNIGQEECGNEDEKGVHCCQLPEATSAQLCVDTGALL
jgi:hypothetical protein